MASQNCIYKTVKMAAGETFVLPPGATLISASDASAVTSSCPDPIPNIPQKCWRLAWVLNQDPDGGRNVRAIVNLPPLGGGLGTAEIVIPKTGNAWEMGDGDGTDLITISKISIGGNISIANIPCNIMTQVDTAVTSNTAGALLSDRKYGIFANIQDLTFAEQQQWQGWWQSGYFILAMYFKATEEIAKTVYFEFASSTGTTFTNIGSLPRMYAEEIDCEAYPTTTLVPSCDDGNFNRDAGTSDAVFTLTGGHGACTSAVVAGTYTNGVFLNPAVNTMTIQVNVGTTGVYSIATNTVNGFSFSSSGNFTTTGSQTVVLQGNGTPIAAGATNFIVSGSTSTCTITVNVA